MHLFNKLISSFAKPEVIIITGKNRTSASNAVFKLLGSNFKLKKLDRENVPVLTGKEEILILETPLSSQEELDEAKFFIRQSSKLIFIATNVGDIVYDKETISGENKNAFFIKEFIKSLPETSILIVNSDDEILTEAKGRTRAVVKSFGFCRGSFVKASDINVSFIGTSLKINNNGSSVPFKIKKMFGKENIYACLAAFSVGLEKKMNLIEITKELETLDAGLGKMRIVEGIKNTLIFDNSLNDELTRFDEAIELFKKIGYEKRRISVVGDIFGMGKYTIAGYEEVGRKLQSASDVLFAIGARTGFMAQSAKKSGMLAENIFQSNDFGGFKNKVKEKISSNDFIFVDGSKDFNMAEIVEEISKK